MQVSLSKFLSKHGSEGVHCGITNFSLWIWWWNRFISLRTSQQIGKLLDHIKQTSHFILRGEKLLNSIGCRTARFIRWWALVCVWERERKKTPQKSREKKKSRENRERKRNCTPSIPKKPIQSDILRVHISTASMTPRAMDSTPKLLCIYHAMSIICQSNTLPAEKNHYLACAWRREIPSKRTLMACKNWITVIWFDVVSQANPKSQAERTCLLDNTMSNQTKQAVFQLFLCPLLHDDGEYRRSLTECDVHCFTNNEMA